MGIWSIIMLIISVVIIFIGTSKFKVNAFFIMIFVAFLYGLSTGIKPIDVVNQVKAGFGDMFIKTGLLYIYGIIVGTFLEKSGATVSIARVILKFLGAKRAPLAAAFSGYFVSIPINCDSGFVILSPMSRAISNSTNIPLITINIALACGLYSTHTLVPPTAGPTAVATTLNADLGKVVFLGMIVSFIATIVSYFIVKIFCKTKTDTDNINVPPIYYNKLPNAFHSFIPIIYPIIMICMNTFSNLPSRPFGNGSLVNILNILGEPTTAMLVSVLFSFTLITKDKLKVAASEWTSEALRSAATIVLINSAAGAFASVLSASPMIDFISSKISLLNLGIFLPFLIAAILKTAQGSSTVSMVTTAGIIAPLLPKLGLDPVICILAIGAGSMIISHTNDSYFWVVSQFSGMDVKTALRNFSLPTAFVGVISFIVILILNIFM